MFAEAKVNADCTNLQSLDAGRCTIHPRRLPTTCMYIRTCEGRDRDNPCRILSFHCQPTLYLSALRFSLYGRGRVIAASRRCTYPVTTGSTAFPPRSYKALFKHFHTIKFNSAGIVSGYYIPNNEES